MHWYKRDPDAALAGMAQLSAEERGAYNSILDLLYSRDGNVPFDDDQLVARMISLNRRTWTSLKNSLTAHGKIWRKEDGLIGAKRVETTLKEASNLSVKQSRNASKRWEESKNLNLINDPSIPGGIASTTTTTATTTKKDTALPAKEWKHPLLNTQTINGHSKKAKKDDSQDFIEFWAPYPRKEEKEEARKEYAKAIQRTSPDKILAALKQKIPQWAVNEPKFTPKAGNWLRRGGWEDEIIPPPPEPRFRSPR